LVKELIHDVYNLAAMVESVNQASKSAAYRFAVARAANTCFAGAARGQDVAVCDHSPKPLQLDRHGPAPINVAGFSPVTGRITGLAADPRMPRAPRSSSRPPGRLWGTAPGGWSPLTDSQPGLFMGAIALAPSNPSVIYAGTERPTIQPTPSTDAGPEVHAGWPSWTLIQGNIGQNEFNRQSISKIVVHPTNPNIVYVAVTNVEYCRRQYWNLGIDGRRDQLEEHDGPPPTNIPGAPFSGIGTTSDSFSDLVMDPTIRNLVCGSGHLQGGSAFNGVYVTTDGGITGLHPETSPWCRRRANRASPCALRHANAVRGHRHTGKYQATPGLPRPATCFRC